MRNAAINPAALVPPAANQMSVVDLHIPAPRSQPDSKHHDSPYVRYCKSRRSNRMPPTTMLPPAIAAKTATCHRVKPFKNGVPPT